MLGQELGKLLKTWWPRIAGFGALAAGGYYGARKLMTTWDWYLDTYVDMPVADIVRRRAFLPPHKSYFGPEFDQTEKYELCYKAEDIARALHKSEKSVLKSLLRLERRGKVVPTNEGWHWKD